MLTVAHAPTDGLPTPDDVTVPNTSVTALIVTAGSIRHELHTGLMKTLLYDQEQRFGNYRGELISTSGANISKARNQIIRRFLDETDSEWAWFLDSDMVIKPDTLPRLLCSAAVSGAKVMGGLCCMVGDDGPIPTTFQLGDPRQGEVTRVMLDYQENTITQVAATGAACLLIHRDVLEHFRTEFPDRNYPWIFEDEISGQWVSEDVLFTLRCNEAGFPVFVDCSTEIGHVKGGKTVWPSDIRKGKGFPDHKTYAIIPSKTHSLALDTVAQLRGEVDMIVLLDNGIDYDSRVDGLVHPNAVRKMEGITPRWAPDVHLIDAEGMGIHEMWNAGIDWALEDADQRRNVNLLILNDDLELGPRFVPRMVEALRSDSNLVAVSGNYDGRAGPLVQEVQDICAGRYDGTGGFAGFAFAVKGEWMSSGYRFPEECKWWYGDNDLVQAAHLSGVGKVGIAIDATVVHLDGGSKTGGDWSAYQDQLDKDRIAFEKRWEQILNPPKPATVAVISSIYGGYDQPTHPCPQYGVTDWVLVTDSDEPPPAPWRALHLPRPDVDPRYAGKAAKYQPFEFVDADVIVWVDGRCEPVKPEFVQWLIESMGEADMAIYRHWGRSSILDEARAALEENPAKYAGHPLIEQAESYLKDYDDVNLWQTTFFAIRRNDRTLAMGKRWMEEQDRYPDCLLDQIPLPPVIAECGVKVADLPGTFWDRHNDLFVLRPHIDGT